MKQHPQDFRLTRYLGPRYWGTWLLLGVMRLVSLLPWLGIQAIGSGLGRLLYRLGGSRRAVAEANIRACFPELTAQEQQQLVRDTFIANAKGYVECTHGWWRDIGPYARKMNVEGLEFVEAAKAQGKGVLLVGGHFSILDFALPLVAAAAPVGYMYRPNDNPLLNAIVERSRRRYCSAAFTKLELRDMIQYIKASNMVWYAVDQDMGPKHSVFAPFFGIPAASIKTTGWLARASDAVVLMLSQFRGPNGVYTIRFTPVPDFPTSDDVQNATVLNQLLEAEIRRHPDQYLWLHRRFKTRPEGAEPFYPRRKRKS